MKTKIPKRDYTLGIRLKPNERQYIEREASALGVRVSDFARDVLLAPMRLKYSYGK